jgi:chitinase
VPLVGRSLANSSTGFRDQSNKIAATWYAGWHGTDFPPAKISWHKYTSVMYAFAYVSISWQS